MRLCFDVDYESPCEECACGHCLHEHEKMRWHRFCRRCTPDFDRLSFREMANFEAIMKQLSDDGKPVEPKKEEKA